jgi:hypothetical protein
MKLLACLWLKIYHAMKGCAKLARCTAISNLTVACKLPYKVKRTEIMSNYGIEYVPYIEHGNGKQGEMLFK